MHTDRGCDVNCKYDEILYEKIIQILNKRIAPLPSTQQNIIHCKECEYGVQDEYERWYCRGFGCQVGEEDGSGFCADAERKNNV